MPARWKFAGSVQILIWELGRAHARLNATEALDRVVEDH
jgi:hypothetical protein